ncbi:MAG: benzoate/H(+) symporter BenE family transporter [Herbaspirillum sp.]|jgi:benzoate membrane transport protein|uniref:benzoate/H(+) symporter BenE family transporter n=1 Tax=Herbaspirillum sp. TaxID=1890675 RepID=UPI0025880CEF|nr:benzoate/H(+) symporter BenE family transporter [Herbaspirillum sp.]MCP3656819.1 benzoate/H(+) symporter BenE family transporter [Herbaspirillum sp.]MCP3950577.1 benzoate/H(+) symporter BenE family transporter [Herbaspirillum sp.]MCP4031112.1 benzoate/H(+) symporter BenE family transporter [Herbaspirillum sp.]
MAIKHGSLTAWVAGFLAVLISYAGPLVIFVQAAHVGRVADAELISWIWAISIGAGLSGLLLSWWLKLPIITAWSAPGTALLLSLFPSISMPEVVGAYLTAAVIIIVIGVTGYFEKIVAFIPRGIAAGMMAGILFQFGVQAFRSSMDAPLMVFAMVAAYLAGKRWWPRYVIVVVAVVGFAAAMAAGKTNLQVLSLSLASPVFIAPQFNLGVFLSFTVPLVLVSLTGQYLPGMAVLQLAGYRVPSRAVVAGTGVASLVTACFGGITTVLAAITAALCTGKDAHHDPGKRYIAGIANGTFYLVGGTFAGTIVQVFTAFPSSLIAALAGLALIGAIVSNVRLMTDDASYVEPSVITFLATASGMSLFGLGAAFWGVVLGMASYWLIGRPKTA